MSAPGWGPPPPGGPDAGWAPQHPAPGWGPPLPPGPPAPGGSGPAVCFRHPDRATGLRCARCGRPSCPECLREAAVGFQCVVCVAEGRRDVRTATTVAGARVRQGTPAVTYALIGVNVAVFVLTAVLARDVMANNGSSFFRQYSLVPYRVADDGELARLVVSGFLHYGLLHVALNMYALFVLGRELELTLGRWRYGALYAVSLLGGSAAVMVLGDPSTATVGASGAVFGLMGALAVVLLKLKRSPGPVFTVIAVNVVISVVVPGISLFGHLGGLVAGAAAAAVILYVPAGPRRAVLQGAGLLALTVLLVVVVALRVETLRAQVGL